MLRYSWLLHHPPLAGILVFLQSYLQPLFGLSDVDLAGIRYTTLDCLPRGNYVSFTLVNIKWRVHPELKTTLMLPANMPDVLPRPSSYIGYHHQWSLLLLLSLVWVARICCFLCGRGRGIADEVCRTTVLLEDSSKVVNFLLKIVLRADDPSGPIMETSHHPSLHVGRCPEILCTYVGLGDAHSVPPN